MKRSSEVPDDGRLNIPTQKTIFHVHATSKNKGDEALLVSLLKILDPLNAEFTDVCTEPEKHANVTHFVDSRPLERISHFFKVAREIKRSDLLVLGGGDVITASNNLLLMAMASVLNRKTFCIGVGVNLKQTTKVSNYFLSKGIKSIQKAYVRDSRSALQLKELGVNQDNIVDVPDLTFFLGANGLAPRYSEMKRPIDKKYVAFSIRAPEYNSAKWGDDEYKEIAKALDAIVERSGLSILMVPMAGEYVKECTAKVTLRTDEIPDIVICQKIRSYMANKDCTSILDPSASMSEIVAVFHHAEMAICCRLHAMIFSTLVGTPFVTLKYNLKSDAYLNDTGLSKYGVNISGISSDLLSDKACNIIDNKESAEKEVENARDSFLVKARKYEQIPKDISQLRKTVSYVTINPKLWCLFLINWSYSVYAKISRYPNEN